MGNSYPITGIQGSTLLITLNCQNSDGTYINLSGYGTRGYIREKFGSTGILFDLNPRITSYESGQIYISGSATGIASLTVGVYPYDIEAFVSGDDGYVFKPIGGYSYIFPEATF